MPDRATESEFHGARIEILTPDGSIRDVIGAQFNPTEYSLDTSVQYGEQSLPGRTTPVTQFVSGDAETLSVELFFDAYGDEEVTDVREYTDRIDALMEIDDAFGGPPVCRFAWSSLAFTCVVESANKQFTMYRSDGTPVRARVDVTFREYAFPEESQSEDAGESPGATKVWQVTQGDTLWGIAAVEYGDPTKWRAIAEENGVDNPRTLQIGQELVIPPLESA